METKEIFKAMLSDPFYKIGLGIICLGLLILIIRFMFTLAPSAEQPTASKETTSNPPPVMDSIPEEKQEPKSEKKEQKKEQKQKGDDNRKGIFNEESNKGTQYYSEGDININQYRKFNDEELKYMFDVINDPTEAYKLNKYILIQLSTTSNGSQIVTQLSEIFTKAGYTVNTSGIIMTIGILDGIDWKYHEQDKMWIINIGQVADKK